MQVHEPLERGFAQQREQDHAQAGQDGIAQDHGAVQPRATVGQFVLQILEKVWFTPHVPTV